MVQLYKSIKHYFSQATLVLVFFAWPNLASAHCPLCTIGAGMAAGIALWLGVSPTSIGLFIGALSIAFGLWIAKLIPKHFKFKFILFALLSFIITIIPLMSLIPGYYPVFINLSGDYGSTFNRTYLINLFLLGAIIGAIIMRLSPIISSQIKKLRHGQFFKFQTMIITFGLLIALSIIIELFN